MLVSPVFSPDGALLAANGRGIVTVWNARTGAEVHRFGSHDLMNTAALAFSPDGRILAAGSRAQLRLRQAPGPGFPLEAVPGHGAALAAWDLATGHRLFATPAGDYVSALAFTGDGALLAVSGQLERPGAARLLDPRSGRAIRTVLEKVDAQAAAAISPDGRWLAGAARTGGVKLWKLR